MTWKVLEAMSKKNVSWNARPCNLVKFTDVSNEPVAVTFLVQKYPADGDSMSLRNTGTLYR